MRFVSGGWRGLENVPVSAKGKILTGKMADLVADLRYRIALPVPQLWSSIRLHPSRPEL